MFLNQDKLRSLASKLSFKRLASGFSYLSIKEKIFFLSLAVLGFVGLVVFSFNFYFSRTVLIPRNGGVYTEGIISYPRFVNPIIPDQSDAEEALESLIFSSLFKSDNNGGVMPDLAETMNIFENGKVYLITLRDNLFWHDNEKLTTQDIAFTIELFKNPEIKSPLGDFWREISVEILSDKTMKFTLKKNYQFFPFYLTFKVLPKHLWQDIQTNSLVFSELNLKPIGSGPYKFKKLIQEKDGKVLQYSLAAFDRYYLEGPYLESFVLKFYPDETTALAALRKKEINGLTGIPSVSLSNYRKKTLPMLSIFSLFFNNENELFQDKNVRNAINLATNKQKIIDEAINGAGQATDAVVIAKDFLSQNQSVYDPEKAREILKTAGWEDKDDDGILEKRLSTKTKTYTKLELSILYHDIPELGKVVESIKNDLNQVGISIVLKPLGINEFSSRLQSRSYQMVLLGETSITGGRSDPYPFWHSTQVSSLGLNFPIYKNKDADKLLEQIRDPGSRNLAELYLELNELIKFDQPGVSLYASKLNFLIDDSFHVPEMGVLGSFGDRFSRANEWYLYLKRVWIPQ
ncbi:MAG: hypothetical protein UX26_C0002G0052 [Parcubacteria group bacterium GW2011_GWC1_45_9]|nr:MAG: hypothetical protein UW89_C0009G0009 [Parcubacteria group bacterium GW2011_GWB1_45_10]KKU17396.1 MAG: hypothetical protein UX26_C0002G0052 [Parcubacteria group bacterium GW2011_GWC1_45_9]HCI05370.1 hypothetical protein [Patescibacteria group bacterium]